MKRGWVWAALLLSLGVNIGILSTLGIGRLRAKNRWERQSDDEHRPPPFARLADHLELEGEQRARFLEVQKELFESTRQLRRQLEEVRTELRAVVMAEPPDTGRMEDLLQESARINVALERVMIESVLETREILDREQQRRYFGVMERLRQASHRFGSRDGRPPPPRRPRDP